jgi:hypothetical protein
MFLRSTKRKKDGKEHHYFSVVENIRLAGRRAPFQKTLLYLGEINDAHPITSPAPGQELAPKLSSPVKMQIPLGAV